MIIVFDLAAVAVVVAGKACTIVLTNMIHDGVYNQQCPSMDNRTCTKRFPKPFHSRTLVDQETSHPVYQHHSPEEGGGPL